ncbi:dynein regulatory complex protein 9-like isoform 2-T2 [Rhinophrynus dorsalis]
MTTLPVMDVLRMCTVLEDSLDQLSILGYIMPVSYHGRSDIVGNEIDEILKTQRQLEGRYEELMQTRLDIQLTSPPLSNKLLELNKQVQETSGKLKLRNEQFTRAVRQSPLTSDNLRKVQADRQFAADVITNMLAELETSGSFQSLQQAVAREKERKTNFYNTIVREEEGRRKIKSLQKQLQDVRKEKEVEIQNVKVKMDEEIRVHVEIENFLRQHQQELEEKLEYWMEKYDKDTEEKQAELNSLKASRANDLILFQELALQYKEYEKVIIEDRLEKEKLLKQKKQEKLELASVIKLQAWWRGMMVRKGLGPYKKTKSKKGKDKGKKGKTKKDGKKK